MNNTPTVAPIDKEQETNEINKALLMTDLTHKGGIIKTGEDDWFIVSAKSFDSLEKVISTLDDSPIVDEYDMSVYVKENENNISKVDIAYDDLAGLDNFIVDVLVFLNPSFIDYTEYADVDEYDDVELFERFSPMNRKKPLWIALNGTKTKTKGGVYVVEPHPKHLDTIWVYIEYKFPNNVPHDEFFADNKDTIATDVDMINTGLIFNKFTSKGFKLKRPLTIDHDEVDFITTYQKAGRLQTRPVEFTHKQKGFNVRLLLEMFDDSIVFGEVGVLNEIKRQLKVNFRGQKRIKLKCQKGYKYDRERQACVKIGGSELSTMRKAKRQMVRTKKAKGSGYKKMVVRKTKKAMRFRKLMGK